MNIPTKPISTSFQSLTYTELRQQIHHDLRIQHPEWVQPNGESPICDAYETRLMELLDSLGAREPHESICATQCAFEPGLNRIDTLAV